MEALNLPQMMINKFSVFVGHGDAQHVRAGWAGNHALQYHIYLICKGVT